MLETSENMTFKLSLVLDALKAYVLLAKSHLRVVNSMHAYSCFLEPYSLSHHAEMKPWCYALILALYGFLARNASVVNEYR